MGLLLAKSDRSIHGIYCQRGHVQQGVFPAPDHAAVHRDFQPGALRYSVWVVSGGVGVLSGYHLVAAPQLDSAAHAAAGSAHGIALAGAGYDFQRAYYQVPRPGHAADLWGAAGAVCHAGYLPAVEGAAEVPVADSGQPDERHYRNVSGRLPGFRHV